MLPEAQLSRREREVMEILHRLGRATAAETRGPLTPEEKRRLKELIDRAEEEGR